jgi:hypothetical protein
VARDLCYHELVTLRQWPQTSCGRYFFSDTLISFRAFVAHDTVPFGCHMDVSLCQRLMRVPKFRPRLDPFKPVGLVRFSRAGVLGIKDELPETSNASSSVGNILGAVGSAGSALVERKMPPSHGCLDLEDSKAIFRSLNVVAAASWARSIVDGNGHW